MKRKILSLTIALMLLISLTSALSVGAISYSDDSTIILDVADLQRESANQPNYTTSGVNQYYSSWSSLSNVSWSTGGAIEMLTGVYAEFTFDITKTGAYEVIVAGYESSATATADIYVDGTKALSGKTVSATSGEHSLGVVILEKEDCTLKIQIPTGRIRLYNIKVAYVGDIPNSYYDVVLDVADLQRESANQPNYTTSGVNQYYSSWPSLGNVSWSTGGAIEMLTGVYAEFTFDITKTGAYEVIVAGYESSATATADVYVDGTKALSGKTVSATSGEHSLGVVILEKEDCTLKIQIPTGRIRLYNIKIAYIGDISNDIFDIVVPAYSGTLTNVGGNGQTITPDNNQGWIPTGAFLCNGVTKTSAVYSINVVKEGYYDVLIPSGSRTENVHAFIDLYNGNAILATGCILSGTSSATDVNVNNVYTTYLTEGVYDFKIEFRANTAWVYGMKFAYQGTQKTEHVIEAVSPARVETLYTNHSIYGTNNVTWSNAGNINVASSGGAAEYDFYISDGGYYTIAIAAASGPNSLISVDIDTTNVANRTEYSGENSSLTDSATVIEAFDLARTYIPSGAHTLKLYNPSNASLIYDIKLSLDSNQPSDDLVRLIKQNGLSIDSSVISGKTVCAEIRTTKSVNDFNIIIGHYSDDTDTKKMLSCTMAPATTVVTDDGKTVYRTSLTLSDSGGVVKAFLWSADGKYMPLAPVVSAQLNIPSM